MSELESSLAGVESERRLLQTEVTVLREEYQYIKKGMSIMEKFFTFDGASKEAGKEEEMVEDEIQETRDILESSDEEEPKESEDEELVEINRKLESTRKPDMGHRLDLNRKLDISKRDTHKRIETPKRLESGRSADSPRRVEKKPIRLSAMDKARLHKLQDRPDLRRSREAELTVYGRRAVSAPDSSNRDGSPRPADRRVTSRSEERPSTKAKDISSRVQKELAKRFPIRTTTGKEDVRKDWMPKRRTQTEIKPLLDVSKVRDMGVDELRKRRLAMLVQSYTGRQGPDSLKKRMEQSSTESASEAEETASTKLRSRLGKHEQVRASITGARPHKPVTPSPVPGQARPDSAPNSQRRKLPFIPRQHNADSASSNQSDEFLSLPGPASGSSSQISAKGQHQGHDSAYTSERTSDADHSDSTPYISRTQRKTSTPTRSSQPVPPPFFPNPDSGVSDIDHKSEIIKAEISPRSARVPLLSKPYLGRSNENLCEKTETTSSTRLSMRKEASERVAPWTRNVSRESVTAISNSYTQDLNKSVSQSKDTPVDTDSGSTSSSVRDLISSLNERTKPMSNSHDSTSGDKKYPNTDGAFLTLSDLQSSRTRLEDHKSSVTSRRRSSGSTAELLATRRSSSDHLGHRPSLGSGSDVGDHRWSCDSASELDLLVTQGGDIIKRSQSQSSISSKKSNQPSPDRKSNSSSLDRSRPSSRERIKSSLEKSKDPVERSKASIERSRASIEHSKSANLRSKTTTLDKARTSSLDRLKIPGTVTSRSSSLGSRGSLRKTDQNNSDYWKEPKRYDNRYENNRDDRWNEPKKYGSSISDIESYQSLRSPRTDTSSLASHNKYSSHGDVRFSPRDRHTTASLDTGLSRTSKYDKASSLRSSIRDGPLSSASRLDDPSRTIPNAWTSTQSLHVTGQNLAASIRGSLLDDPGNIRPTDVRSTGSLNRSDHSLDTSSIAR